MPLQLSQTAHRVTCPAARWLYRPLHWQSTREAGWLGGWQLLGDMLMWRDG
jgi:hypothetical protein